MSTAMLTRTRSAAATQLPRFPFFAAGDASYFEWFEVYVWFAAPISKPKRAAIVKMAPSAVRVVASYIDESKQPAKTKKVAQRD